MTLANPCLADNVPRTSAITFMLTVLIFHAGPALGLPTVSVDVAPGERGMTHASMVDLAFRSVTLFHPHCRKVLLTDAATQFPGLSGTVEMVRRDLDASKLMLERKRSQLEFLQRPDLGESDVLMLDADMLMNAPVHDLFGNGMALGLSYRDKRGMPLNGGLIAVSRKFHTGARLFLERVIELMERHHYHDVGSYRDQHALIDVVGHDRFERRASDVVEIEGIGRIVLWPCHTHNHTPPNADGSIYFRDPRCKFVHFKGPRKRLMPGYWEQHLAGRELAAARGAWWRRWLGTAKKSGPEAVQ
jgi:hypothetical protein